MKFTAKGVNLIKTIGYQPVIPVSGDNELSKILPDIEYEITIQKKKNKNKENQYEDKGNTKKDVLEQNKEHKQ